MLDDEVVHVVEDDPPMRDALLLLLQSAGLRARGYVSAEDFLSKEGEKQRACVLVDVRLPGMDGLALQRHLFARGAEPAIVMITGHGDVALAVAALKSGAMDFVTKPFSPAELLESVRGALRRSADARQRAVAIAGNEARFQTLTPRERSIFARLAEGQSSKLIAAELGISVRTVEHHRASIMEKLRVRTLSKLIRTAVERNP
ncbi:MAG: response regulator transcription factor [Hyphomicrobiales bacterium]|nr:response regulator transcription factor [Hyphomicrobiales bacterium]